MAKMMAELSPLSKRVETIAALGSEQPAPPTLPPPATETEATQSRQLCSWCCIPDSISSMGVFRALQERSCVPFVGTTTRSSVRGARGIQNLFIEWKGNLLISLFVTSLFTLPRKLMEMFLGTFWILTFKRKGPINPVGPTVIICRLFSFKSP